MVKPLKMGTFCSRWDIESPVGSTFQLLFQKRKAFFALSEQSQYYVLRLTLVHNGNFHKLLSRKREFLVRQASLALLME